MLLQLVVWSIVEVTYASVNTYHRLQGIERILSWILFVINIGLRNDVVFLMTTHQVNVLLTMLIHCSLQAQLLIHSIVELLTEVWDLLDE